MIGERTTGKVKTLRVFEGDRDLTRLSAAYWLSDAFTRRGPVEGFRVRIANLRVQAVRNPTGFRCFVDLPPGTHAVRVEPDNLAGLGPLLPERLELIVPPLDPADAPPVEPTAVPLLPSPTYPFPSTATLARGRVVEPAAADSLGIADVDITVIGQPALRARTIAGGNFVLFFVPASAGAGAVLRFETNGAIAEQWVNVPEGTTQNIGNIVLG